AAAVGVLRVGVRPGPKRDTSHETRDTREERRGGAFVSCPVTHVSCLPSAGATDGRLGQHPATGAAVGRRGPARGGAPGHPPPAELFDSFDPKPLATASVGQVHVATLRGRKLAVKVRRPSVEAEFGGDIRLMAAALGLIRRLGLRRLAWVVEPISEFIAWTR